MVRICRGSVRKALVNLAPILSLQSLSSRSCSSPSMYMLSSVLLTLGPIRSYIRIETIAK